MNSLDFLLLFLTVFTTVMWRLAVLDRRDANRRLERVRTWARRDSESAR